ncbi:hypothetical protein L596_000284 [Steinernema carpocapsae]|uniref:Uncharacterized protein n=1 Tax=Steinernema carpocapsae TaxID=34508 RepID=A0A4U8UIJ1_STECR|nr:hypothetical protein L596_000283 [Steinernema carpocapsae]TMS32451.1 hypothetical protein L596_000284 [Steinernema carpocapsae]
MQLISVFFVIAVLATSVGAESKLQEILNKNLMPTMATGGDDVAIDFEARSGEPREEVAEENLIRYSVKEADANCPFNKICSGSQLFQCEAGCIGFDMKPCDETSCNRFNACFPETTMACHCECKNSTLGVSSSILTRCCN